MPVSNVYNNQNQPNGTGGFDAAGNQIALGTYSIAYDAENRELSVSDTTGTEVQAGYDAFGQRVTKNNTVYVYDALGNLVAEYNSGPAAAVACGTCYLSSDYLGSIRLVTDSQNSVVSRHDFLPFGDEVDAKAAERHSEWGSTSDNIAQRFTGQARDQETAPALDYFHARYYSNAIARFTSADPGNAGADPLNPQSWNAYAYALNSPLLLVDPFGLSCVSLDDGSSGDNGDGQGCAAAGVSAGNPNDPNTLNQGQINASVNDQAPSLDPWSTGINYGNVYSGTANFSVTGYGSAPGQTSSAPPTTGPQNNDSVVIATKKANQLVQCAADHFGLTGLGSGLAAAGANLLGTGGKFTGATPGTSLASKAAGSLLGDLKLPFRLPTLTGFPGIGNGLRVSLTGSAARFAGRAVPVVGYALLAYDAYEIGTCTVNGGE